MSRTENVELTVLCLITDGDRILLQNRTKNDWQGYTLPGGHVEPGESFVDVGNKRSCSDGIPIHGRWRDWDGFNKINRDLRR